MKKHFILPILLTIALTGCGNKQAQQTEGAQNGEATDEQTSSIISTTLPEEAVKASESYVNKGTPTVFFFFAEWCPACRAFKPTLEQIEAKYPGVKVLRMNVDEQKDLTKTFKVTSIPTLFLFDKDGKFVESTTGGLAEDKLAKEFEKIAVSAETATKTEVSTEAGKVTEAVSTTSTTTTTEQKVVKAEEKAPAASTKQ
jgi:thioredoxin 1